MALIIFYHSSHGGIRNCEIYTFTMNYYDMFETKMIIVRYYSVKVHFERVLIYTHLKILLGKIYFSE